MKTREQLEAENRILREALETIVSDWCEGGSQEDGYFAYSLAEEALRETA